MHIISNTLTRSIHVWYIYLHVTIKNQLNVVYHTMDGMVVRPLRNPSILQNFPSPKSEFQSHPKKTTTNLRILRQARGGGNHLARRLQGGPPFENSWKPFVLEEFFSVWFFFGEMLNLEILRHWSFSMFVINSFCLFMLWKKVLDLWVFFTASPLRHGY